MSKTIFKSSSIEKIEEYYQNVHINAEQRERINSFTQILGQYLPIPERALKGFLWRVLINIQKKYHIDFVEEGKRTDVSLAERMGAIQEIFTILKEELIRGYGVPEQKVRQISNAVNLLEFDECKNFEKNPIFAMSCGRNIARKDFSTFISACNKAKIPYKLFHGELSRRELIKMYKTASIFVCSSLYETGPITVLEAMASKCPVICSAISAIKGVIIDGKTGLLFRTGDIEDLVKKMQYLLWNELLKQKLTENAYNHVKTNFNWEKVAKQTIAVYEELL